MADSITSVWAELEKEAERTSVPAQRLYRALGDTATGIRAAYLPHQQMLELLIEVPSGWSGEKVLPQWRGMGHELLALYLPPREDAIQLRLFLENPEHRDIFLLVCEDLVAALEGIKDAAQRVIRIEASLMRWKKFFERSGAEGLPTGTQQGLFAELMWLKHILEAGIDAFRAVSAWKGCERAYHDYDFNGHVVEVKSTKTKEPRSVVISNERQLDDRGLSSLYLYTLSINQADGGGITLPEQVEYLRNLLGKEAIALSEFRGKLISAGYLDRDAWRYKHHYIVMAEDLFKVIDGFPRIIKIPAGVGDIRYRVLLSSCEPFREDFNEYLSGLMEQTSGK